MNKWLRMMLQGQCRFWEKNLVIICFIYLKIWRGWSVNIFWGLKQYFQPYQSQRQCIILSKKNYKYVWNSFLKKWTCEWRRPPRIRMDFRIHSRKLFLDWGCRSIRRLVHSVIGYLCIPLKTHKLTRWTWRWLQRMPVLGRIFKNQQQLWEEQNYRKND